MILPYINEIPTTRQWNDVFYGYNHNLRIGEGEFYDMKNMTGDDFPVLSPREKRGVYAAQLLAANDDGTLPESQPQGLISKEALCWVDGSKFYINSHTNGYNLGLTVNRDQDGKIIPKRLVSMGSYVIIMPDKKYININSPSTDRGDIEETFELDSGNTATFSMSMMDGTKYGTIHEGAAPPTDTSNAWIDTSQIPHEFKIYSATSKTWTTVATSYIKISAKGLPGKLNIGDAITLSGITDNNIEQFEGTTAVIAGVGQEENEPGTGYIIIPGLIKQVVNQTGNLAIKRAVPDMDFVVESGNRLWGCRYYERDKDGMPVKVLNEIYASKLGDFRNWYVYQGTAADSYAVTVGTDGEFTGAATHLGYPIFFKENYMHKIYGNFPSNFQVQTTACRGVQNGSADSIATVNEVLYYKARSGIVAYDGSLPTEISSALGDESYDKARAGWLGNKYYVSMRDSKNQYHLFVYDTKRGMWHREDATEAVCFCNRKGDLYYIDYASKQIKAVRGVDCKNEKGETVYDGGEVNWEVETGALGTETPDKKYISKLDVRMKLSPGATVSFYAEYDSSGEWEHLFNMTGRDLKSFAVPVRPRRCDHMRLKIKGRGETKIFSICKTIEGGSDK